MDRQSDCVSNPPDVSNLTYEGANQAIEIEQKKSICSEYITNLARQVQNGHMSPDNKTLAIYFLGSFLPNDTASIEILIQNIDFKASTFDPAFRVPRWGPYPAEDALIRIGDPVVDPVLNHLSDETNSVRQHLMCEVLMIADGKATETFDESKGKKIAQDQMNAKLRRETDPNKRANLETALKELQNWTNSGQDSRRRFIH